MRQYLQSLLTVYSYGNYSVHLACFYHIIILLHRVVCHLHYIMAIPSCSESTKRSVVYGNIRLSLHVVASPTNLSLLREHSPSRLVFLHWPLSHCRSSPCFQIL
jgi:hypothetical protein